MEEELATPVRLSYRDAKQIADRQWELPPWHTLWGRAVFPLMVSDQNNHLFPLGTAFRFSTLGHILTARHCIEDGLRRHHPHGEQFVREGIEAARRSGKLDHVQLAIVSQGPNPKRGDVSFDLQALNSIHAAPPTDLVVGSILQDDLALVPSLDTVISFAPPRIGEIVRCVGYCDSSVPAEGLSVEEIRAGKINPYEHYSHRLIVVEGRVRNIFIDGLSTAFVNGPCFTIDSDVPHGLSGGPIFNSSGAICGAVYSGASMFFGESAAVGALFYPIFLLHLSYGLSMGGGRLRMLFSDSVADLVASQAIRTDKAEEVRLHFGPEVRAAFDPEDGAHIFQNLDAYQSDSPVVPLGNDGLKGFKPNLEDPFIRRQRGLDEI